MALFRYLIFAFCLFFCLFLLPLDKVTAATSLDDLPKALAEDDSFDELPFEQLRQALRQEVERGSSNPPPSLKTKRYNFFIR